MVRPQLSPSLQESAAEQAVVVLRAYYAAPSAPGAGFTGGFWDGFDPSGTRATSQDVWTSDDVASCALLSAPLGGQAVVELLDRQAGHFNDLLTGVGPDRDLVDLEGVDGPEFAAVRDLYAGLRGLPGVGQTRATKPLARKRPRLVPIVDRVVRETVFAGLRYQWGPLHALLRANGRELHARLSGLREGAGLSEEVSVLRVFDVLAWMDGSGNTARVLRGHPIQPVDLGESEG